MSNKQRQEGIIVSADNEDWNGVTECILSTKIQDLERTVQFFIERAPNNKIERQIEVGSILLQRLVQEDNETPFENSQTSARDNIQQLLRIFVSQIQPHPRLTQEFLVILQNANRKKVLIPSISQISSNSEEELKWIVECCIDLLRTHSELIPPIFGALTELPLNEELRLNVSETAISALKIMTESDVPTIVRALLRMMNKRDGPDVVQAIRDICTTLSDETLFVLCDVLATTLRVNHLAVQLFTQIIEKTSHITSFDIIVILILMQKRREQKSVFTLLKQGFQRGALTLKAFLQAFERRQSCSQLLSSIYALCVYFLQHNNVYYSVGEIIEEEQESAERKSLHSTRLQRSITPKVYWASVIIPKVYTMFRESQEIQTNIIVTLLRSISNPVGTDSGDSYMFISRYCIASDILVKLSKSHDLMKFSNLIEDCLHNIALAYSSSVFSLHSIHAICYVLCRCCINPAAPQETDKTRERLKHSLMIFLRKQLFSGQDHTVKLGIIAATHILHDLISANDEDFLLVLRWLLDMLKSKTFEPSEILILLLDALLYNQQKIPIKVLADIAANYIKPLLQSSKLIQARGDRRASRIFFEIQVTGSTLCVDSFLDRKRSERNHEFMQIITAVQQLLRCYVATDTILNRTLTPNVHKNHSKTYFELLSLGYRMPVSVMKANSEQCAEYLLITYGILTTLCNLYNELDLDLQQVVNTDRASLIFAVGACLEVKSLLMKTKEYLIQGPNPSRLEKVQLIDATLNSFQLDFKLLCRYASVCYADTDSMRFEREFLQNILQAIQQNHFSTKAGGVDSSTKYFTNVSSLLQSQEDNPEAALQQSVINQFLCSDFVSHLIVRIGQHTQNVKTTRIAIAQEENLSKKAEMETQLENSICCLALSFSILAYCLLICRKESQLYQDSTDYDIQEDIFSYLVVQLSESVNPNSAPSNPSPEEAHEHHLKSVFRYFCNYLTKECQEWYIAQYVIGCLVAMSHKTSLQPATSFVVLNAMSQVYQMSPEPTPYSLARYRPNILQPLLQYHPLLDALVLDSSSKKTILKHVLSTEETLIPQAFLQLLLIIPMGLLSEQYGRLYMRDLLLAMYYVSDASYWDHCEAQKNPNVRMEVNLARREHVRYKLITTYNVHIILQVLLKLCTLAITKAPTIPTIKRSQAENENENTDSIVYFETLEFEIQNFIYLINIVLNLCQRQPPGMTAANSRQTMSVALRQCQKLIALLLSKIEQALKYRHKPFCTLAQKDLYTSPSHYSVLMKQMLKFSRCVNTLCDAVKLVVTLSHETASEKSDSTDDEAEDDEEIEDDDDEPSEKRQRAHGSRSIMKKAKPKGRKKSKKLTKKKSKSGAFSVLRNKVIRLLFNLRPFEYRLFQLIKVHHIPDVFDEEPEAEEAAVEAEEAEDDEQVKSSSPAEKGKKGNAISGVRRKRNVQEVLDQTQVKALQSLQWQWKPVQETVELIEKEIKDATQEALNLDDFGNEPYYEKSYMHSVLDIYNYTHTNDRSLNVAEAVLHLSQLSQGEESARGGEEEDDEDFVSDFKIMPAAESSSEDEDEEIITTTTTSAMRPSSRLSKSTRSSPSEGEEEDEEDVWVLQPRYNN